MWPPMRSFTVRLMVLALFHLSACATSQRHVQDPSIPVPPKQVLLRLVGVGPAMPTKQANELAARNEVASAEPVYELCFDPEPSVAQRASRSMSLKSVRRMSLPTDSDAELQSALRAWKWTMLSSRPMAQLPNQSFCYQVLAALRKRGPAVQNALGDH